jgi:signal peptidase I
MSGVTFLDGPNSESEPNGSSSKSGQTAPANKRIGCLIEGVILVMAVALGLLIRFGWLETAIVTSDSMLPTLRRDDRLLVDHRASLHGTWERGDIVVFDAPDSWEGEGETWVKRIIGLPGDTLWLRDGQVWINNVALPENYLNGAPSPETTMPVTLKPDEYFLLGDNRDNSQDSRVHGPLPEASIRGRVTRLLGPWGRGGALAEPGYSSGGAATSGQGAK